ncbi:D-xylose 1-dehydrogenase Gfo6 [Halobellus rubicundus]|uniref:D-xylose 1-dehydrogenase Gfo6 n=1 Tax=Halobellus rubicundus TaxID=2996466 RepID=A0ABD5MCW2_9EURY
MLPLTDFDRRDWQTTTGGTVRFALVGLGWWTTDVAIPAVADADLCEASVLVSGSRHKARRVADRHDVPHAITYEAFHEGEASDAYDAVYVCTPNVHHLEYAETAAEFGKAVLCEKPMEATVERAERMVEACERADVPLMIAYRMHTDPAVRRARELLGDGFIGDPVSVYGNHTQPLLEMIADPDQWRLDPDRTGYGTSVMDLGIYSINTTRFLLGRDPVAVRARMTSTDEAFADVPDERSSATFRFEDDLHMVTTSSQHAQNDTHLKLTGTEGQIELHPAFQGTCTLRLSRGELRATVEHDDAGAEREMREEFDYFADRILSGAEIYADGRHGLTDMRILAAMYESAERDERIEL